MTPQEQKVIEQALNTLRMPCNYWNKTQFIKVKDAIAAIENLLAQQSNEQVETEFKLMPREATREMLEAMDECSMEGYDERLYAGHAGSVYMAAWDAFAHPLVPTAQPKEPEQRITNLSALTVLIEENHKLKAALNLACSYLTYAQIDEIADKMPAQPKEPEQEPNKDGSPCPEFWDWLPKAYNFEGDGNFTKYNMEVAFLAGKQAAHPEQKPVAIHQFRSPHCSGWYDGVPDHHDGHGPYEVRTLYTRPQNPQRSEDINLSCKSTQARLAASWGYVKAEPLTDEQILKIVKDNTVQGYHGDYFDAWGIIDDVQAAHGITKGAE